MPREHKVVIRVADLPDVQAKISQLESELEAVTSAARELADLAGFFWAYADVPGNRPTGQAGQVFRDNTDRMNVVARRVRDEPAWCLICQEGPTRTAPTLERTFTARSYEGQCGGCGGPIHEGQQIGLWSDDTYRHEGCEPWSCGPCERGMP